MVTIQTPTLLLIDNLSWQCRNINERKNRFISLFPLACGVLTGKYIEGKDEANSRLNLFKRFIRYSSNQSTLATKKYLDLANEIGISLTHMALAFVNQQTFVTSNIIGATNMMQLKENIDSIEIKLNQHTIDAINEIHAEIPDPST